MGRTINYITRTITVTTATVMEYDPKTEAIQQATITAIGAYTVDTIEKVARKACEALGHTYLKVKETRTETNLYRMTDEQFIANAEKLPPRANQTEVEAEG